MTRAIYIPCAVDEIPAGVRWDVPGRNQGQIVEVAYATPVRCNSEAGPGDEYRRTTDGSDGSVGYERREDVAPVRWGALERTRGSIVTFSRREEAEHYSRAWHGHDRVVQTAASGGYLDADGHRLTEQQARLECAEAMADARARS